MKKTWRRRLARWALTAVVAVFLATALPAGIGVVAAIMLLAPLSPRGEISFLLDRKKVAIAEERIRVANAMYRGEDNKGRAFTVSAASASQVSARDPQVRMTGLLASMRRVARASTTACQ